MKLPGVTIALLAPTLNRFLYNNFRLVQRMQLKNTFLA
jgi:hypothetical protein